MPLVYHGSDRPAAGTAGTLVLDLLDPPMRKPPTAGRQIVHDRLTE